MGLGRLGTTVAQLVSDTGDEAVCLVRRGPGKIARGRAALDASRAREVRAGRLTDQASANALVRTTVTDDETELGDCEVVVECLPETVRVKQVAAARIQHAMASDAVYASSTSTIPASMIGVDAEAPGRVVVVHYIWPANRVRLVEVAYPDHVDDVARRTVRSLLERQGKEPLVTADRPGFFLARILFVFWSATFDALAAGVSPAEIDTTLEARGWPIGPCRLLDGTGLWTPLDAYEILDADVQERVRGITRLAPLVEAGFTGADAPGLYRRNESGRTPNTAALELLRTQPAPPADDWAEYLHRVIAEEARRCVEEGVVASWADAARGVDGAYGFPGGLLAYVGKVD